MGRIETDLCESEARLKAVVEAVADGILLVDEHGTVEAAVNPAAGRIFGYAPDELAGCDIDSLVPELEPGRHPGYRAATERWVTGARREAEGRCKDGSSFPLELAVSEACVFGRKMFIVMVRDITRRKRAEEGLRARTAELEIILDTVPAAVWLAHDTEGRWISGNRHAARMLRFAPGANQSLTGPEGERPTHYRMLQDGREVTTDQLPIQRAARGALVRNEEYRIAFDDGTYLDELVNAAPVRDASGCVTGAVGSAIDVTERKRAEERVRRLALHDALTGLPNRVLLLDRLEQALARARREGSAVAVLLLDLDGFKDVNDTLGHPAGDQLLRDVAHRLAALVRGSDTLARLGGDEFALVQPQPHRPTDAATAAGKVLGAFAAPFDLDGQEVHASASVGITLFPQDGQDPDALLKNADLALYRAKAEGRDRFRFFEPAMDAAAQARRRLELELRRALERGEFVLHYQPQLELATGRFTGAEALVRWNHPERGLVLPGEFIPLAEANRMIRPLGAWVLREACRQAQAWWKGGQRLTVAVNLSPVQLRDGHLLPGLDAALARAGLEPARLELEVTEGELVENLEQGGDGFLRALTAGGVRLAVDDFGIGYSSLAYLKHLPVQTIKIDRSFVRGVGTDPRDEALVRAIVTLGQSLGKRVVAEGVENEAQLVFLRALGCDAAQGFHIARPRGADELEHLLFGGAGIGRAGAAGHAVAGVDRAGASAPTRSVAGLSLRTVSPIPVPARTQGW